MSRDASTIGLLIAVVIVAVFILRLAGGYAVMSYFEHLLSRGQGSGRLQPTFAEDLREIDPCGIGDAQSAAVFYERAASAAWHMALTKRASRASCLRAVESGLRTAGCDSAVPRKIRVAASRLRTRLRSNLQS